MKKIKKSYKKIIHEEKVKESAPLPHQSAKEEGLQDTISRIIPNWIDVLVKPEETFKREKPITNLKTGVIYTIFGFIILGIISGILSMSLFGIPGIVLSAIFAPILGLVVLLIYATGYFAMAKILGGAGTFGAQYFVVAIVLSPILVLNSIVGIIPLAGGYLALLVGLYAMYPLTLGIKEAHQLNLLKSVIAMLIPTIILTILFAILLSPAGEAAPMSV